MSGSDRAVPQVPGLAKLMASVDAHTERIESPDGEPKDPARPDFLYRIALNFAVQERRTRARILTAAEIDEALCVDDIQPDCEQAQERQIPILAELISELPVGQRSILRAALLERLSHQNLAKRYKTNAEIIAQELQRSLAYVLGRLQ